MIVCDPGPALVRIGEIEVGGRRAAARAIPFAGEAGTSPFRFDPVERRVLLRPESARGVVGPADPEEWRRAIRRAPAGPVLVGPSGDVEAIRYAFRAALEGVLSAGRGAYLLDPDPDGVLDSMPSSCVILFAGIPDDRMRGSLERASSAGQIAGVLFPIVPGWTAGPPAVDAAVAAAADSGARFVVPLAVASDGETRRRLVEARALVESASSEEFFDRVHHADWEVECTTAVARLRTAAAARGLAWLPPRPAGAGEPLPNSRAAARLEELAGGEPQDEHRFSLRLAAARWIDESGRDLAPIVAEGNFRKIFPFGPELAREAEEALGARP